MGSPYAPQQCKDVISPKGLWDLPLIISRQESKGGIIESWLQKDFSKLNIAATYSLAFNGSIMVRDGVGYALVIDNIINVTGESSLCFRPCTPALKAGINVVWKKYQIFSKAAGKYLEKLSSIVTESV